MESYEKLVSQKKFEVIKKQMQSEYVIEESLGDNGILKKVTYKLKIIPVEKYFELNLQEKEYFKSLNEEIKKYVLNRIEKEKILDIKLNDNELIIIGYENNVYNVLNIIRDYYEANQIHITRMFGSYILIMGNESNLKAVKATSIPIKYCPLMTKLLKEVGGHIAEELLKTLDSDNEDIQNEMMCRLINEVVIKGGYFDTNRPLNSCEANVAFGASETIASAFENNIVDAAVIVSNNLGTIITTNSSNTQGAVKRMTGLFFTSPSKKILETAQNSNIISVFPYTAKIDQIAGVKKAIELGYKKIAVTLAANDNYFHQELKKIEEENNVIIYKFGLCSTGINEETALIMKENADVIWSCASKQIREHIEPTSIAQVGIKIPVHIMTQRGWDIIKNHLYHIDNKINYNVELSSNEDKPFFMNEKEGIKMLRKKDIHKCNDCPYPCV